MIKPQPIWQRWLKDPKNAERLYLLYWLAFAALNFFIFIGVVLFFVLWYKR